MWIILIIVVIVLVILAGVGFGLCLRPLYTKWQNVEDHKVLRERRLTLQHL